MLNIGVFLHSSNCTHENPASLGVLLVDNTGSEEICINMELIKESLACLDPAESAHDTGKQYCIKQYNYLLVVKSVDHLFKFLLHDCIFASLK